METRSAHEDDGTIGEVQFFSPAFEAKLAPGDKVVTINSQSFSPAALQQALTVGVRN